MKHLQGQDVACRLGTPGIGHEFYIVQCTKLPFSSKSIKLVIQKFIKIYKIKDCSSHSLPVRIQHSSLHQLNPEILNSGQLVIEWQNHSNEN